MGFFSTLRLAMLGLLVLMLLTPAAGASLLKRGFLVLVGLLAIASVYVAGEDT
ncbi:hypothetical protein [Pyrobaculum neutrophilum]|uniref:hypothetical protein n=1 Tax=Pyrobaculum neutrophilum TaxID=70771 RepID=UPI00164F3AB7|nr:hypothetical protein [Pyrobaculum neutrophilum]